MKYKVIGFGILAALVVLGAACSTPYQAKGYRGGFSETKLADDVYRVRFKGNGYTSRERVEDFVMYRAAELTIGAGYEFFGFTSSEMDTATSISASTNSYSGQVQISTVRRHEGIGTIRMLRKKVPGSYSAREIIANIGQKYGFGTSEERRAAIQAWEKSLKDRENEEQQ